MRDYDKFMAQYPQCCHFEVTPDREFESLGDDNPEYNTLFYHHLKKYKGKYQITRSRLGDKRHEVMYSIRCKGGKIEPYSVIRGLLLFYKSFKAFEDKNKFLQRVPEDILVQVECPLEVVVVFPEDKLDQLKDLFEVLDYTPMPQSAIDAMRKKRESQHQNSTPEEDIEEGLDEEVLE
jgi:hypothetical protein